jgi:hypothetical protein
MIEMMTQMTWNKNLRKSLAKQLSLTPTFDAPFIRYLPNPLTPPIEQ